MGIDAQTFQVPALSVTSNNVSGAEVVVGADPGKGVICLAERAMEPMTPLMPMTLIVMRESSITSIIPTEKNAWMFRCLCTLQCDDCRLS